MCGILVYSSRAFSDALELELLQRDIAARGPNHWGAVQFCGFHFEASVLALRDPVTPQPVVSKSVCELESVLCFNGQVYDLPNGTTQDTLYFHRQLQHGIDEVFSLEGEFAFVYFDRSNQRIYFGRDRLGRRSLLYKTTPSGELIVSSVSGGFEGFTECEAQNTYYTYSLVSKKLDVCHSGEMGLSTVIRGTDAPLIDPTIVLDVLKSAVARRLVRLQSMKHDSVAVMFSGGLDCTIIAGLLDDLLPPDITIDLLNVAFENKRTGSLWDTPDRLLGKRSLQELEVRSRNNRFRFLEINVPYDTAVDRRDEVKRLMHPNVTVMDLSIALAFYFTSEPQTSIVNSPILFSGLGADELFAGYSRHLGSAHDPERLATELELDFSRLPHRNLGRDDRVCASWGREVRYPFLDAGVIDCAMRTPLRQKTDGTTTKILLRDVAKRLGLTTVCAEKKRAIQFGARSAKMDPGSGSLKGHNAL